MRYLTVSKLGKLCGRLSAFARALGERVAAAAAEPFRERLTACPGFPDLWEFQLLLADKLDTMYRQLLAWDNDLAREIQHGRVLRDLRQRLVSELRQEISRLLDLLNAAYGAAAVWRSAGVLPPPHQPDALHLMARRFHGVLNDPSLELPPARHGMEVDATELSTVLEAPMGRLGETLEQLAANESAVAHCRSRKTEAQEQLRSYAERVERFYLALADLGGHDRIAVSPTGRRKTAAKSG